MIQINKSFWKVVFVLAAITEMFFLLSSFAFPPVTFYINSILLNFLYAGTIFVTLSFIIYRISSTSSSSLLQKIENNTEFILLLCILYLAGFNYLFPFENYFTILNCFVMIVLIAAMATISFKYSTANTGLATGNPLSLKWVSTKNTVINKLLSLYDNKKLLEKSFILFVILFHLFLCIQQWSTLKGLWIDEWISVQTSSLFFSKDFPYFASGNPVTYGYVYFALLKIVGTIGPIFYTGRVLNYIFYIAFIYLFYDLVLKITKSRLTSALSILLFSISSFSIYMNNEIRGYTFSLFLTYLLFFLAKSNIKLQFKIPILSIVTLILVDNHISNILIPLAIFVLLTVEVISNKVYQRYVWQLALIGLGLFFLGIIAYKGNPFEALVFFYQKLNPSSQPTWVVDKESIYYPIIYLLNSTRNFIIPLLGLTGFAMTLRKSKVNRYLLLFLVTFIIPICIQQATNGFRYFYIIFPIYCAIISIGLVSFIGKLRKENILRVILPIIIGLIVITTLRSNISDVPWAKTINYETASSSINSLLKSDDIIMTNYMGVQISDYIPKISYILYDLQDSYSEENGVKFGKKTTLGFMFNGKPYTHFILDSKFLSVNELKAFTNQSSKRIIIIIRPWGSDFDSQSYQRLTSFGFTEMKDLDSPLRVFYSK